MSHKDALREGCPTPSEGKFWKYYDKVAFIVRKPSFLYWCAGLYLVGTLLDVLATYLRG